MNEAGAYYDLSLLNSMMSNDTAEVNRMIHIFMETVPEILDMLNESFQKNQMSQLHHYAHKLKSSIDIFHITDLSSTIREIEKKSKENIDLETLPEQVEKVNMVLKKVLEGIKKELN